MKIYLVGGAVRDKLLGLPVKEKDWVVVGAKPEEMLRLGYKQVGKEFPVFLDPKYKEEYALARMERKVAPGYTGFTFDTSPQVTLEEDLLRRDLTINAIAETPDGRIIDPYQGREDISRKILRHVSPAFAEDPVRILRIARFAARFADRGFHVAPETNTLMKNMVESGEVDALVPERVWKEWERALGEKSPVVFFQVLADCGALKKLFPQIHLNDAGINALKKSVALSTDPLVRFAALLHAHDKTDILYLCNHYRLPLDCRELALLVAKYYLPTAQFANLTPEQILDLFTQADAFRREDRFKKFLLACQAVADCQDLAFPSALIEAAYQAVKQVNVKAWLKPDMKGMEIAEKLKEQRLQALVLWTKATKI